MSEHKSFCAKRKKLLGSIIGGANYPKGAYGADWRKPTKPTRAKDVGALLFSGVRSHASGGNARTRVVWESSLPTS